MRTRKSVAVRVKDLRAGSIEAIPINVDDWRDVFACHDGNTYDENSFWEAVECEKCGKVVVLHNGGGDCSHEDEISFHDQDEDDARCDGYLPAAHGPMMNYWYPVDRHGFDPESAARDIADLPLCVVEVNGQYGLALTGGGMDLSWQICEAYMRLGLLPPVHFCDLPRMAGSGKSRKDRSIIAACRKSLTVQIRWAKMKLRSLRTMGKE